MGFPNDSTENQCISLSEGRRRHRELYAAETAVYVSLRVWQNMCAKKSCSFSITYLLILSFQSLFSAVSFTSTNLLLPPPPLLSGSNPAAVLLKVNFFFSYAWLPLVEFDPCSVVRCRFQRLPSLPCSFHFVRSADFFSLLYESFGLVRSGTAGSGSSQCSGCKRGGVGCWWRKLLGGG